jgi:hypothetical protein
MKRGRGFECAEDKILQPGRAPDTPPDLSGVYSLKGMDGEDI